MPATPCTRLQALGSVLTCCGETRVGQGLAGGEEKKSRRGTQTVYATHQWRCSPKELRPNPGYVPACLRGWGPRGVWGPAWSKNRSKTVGRTSGSQSADWQERDPGSFLGPPQPKAKSQVQQQSGPAQKSMTWKRTQRPLEHPQPTPATPTLTTSTGWHTSLPTQLMIPQINNQMGLGKSSQDSF